ncbi:MAG: SDR family NAD(P)-dependent oxidoreductase, partial [Bryobacteraceae bacterium]
MSVLITGANGGLGTAVSKAFLETGATVIGVAKSWPEKAPFLALSLDLTTAEGCDAMVAQALEHGPIEALVHILGGFGGGESIAETSDKTWDGMMTLNLRAAFCAMRAVL